MSDKLNIIFKWNYDKALKGFIGVRVVSYGAPLYISAHQTGLSLDHQSEALTHGELSFGIACSTKPYVIRMMKVRNKSNSTIQLTWSICPAQKH